MVRYFGRLASEYVIVTLQGLKDLIRYGLAAFMFVTCILNLWFALYVIGLVIVSEIVHWVVHGDREPTATEAREILRRNGYTVSDRERILTAQPLSHADGHQKGPPDPWNDPLDCMDR
jgi:hypothetical protein